MSNIQKNQITVKLHYSRPDGDYAGWNAWMWTLKQGGMQYELAQEGEDRVATIVVDGYTTACVSFIVRKGNWEEQEFNERRIDVSTVSAGTVHYYVTSGEYEGELVMDEDVVQTNKLLSVELDYDTGKLLVQTSINTMDPGADAFSLVCGDGEVVPVAEVAGDEGNYAIMLDRFLRLREVYQYRLRFRGFDYPIQTNSVYASRRFAQKFTYDGKDLGANWAPDCTIFKVWAPTAEAVKVAIYRSGTVGTKDRIETLPMKRCNKGVWCVRADGNRNG